MLGQPDPDEELLHDPADPFVRECLESPVVETPVNQTLSMKELTAVLKTVHGNDSCHDD